MHTASSSPLLFALALIVSALPAVAMPTIPGDVTETILASGFQSSGVGFNDVPGTLSVSDSNTFNMSSGSAFAETEALYGSIVAPNEIQGLGASIAQADMNVPCGPPSCAVGSTRAIAEYVYYLGLSGPGGVLVPVDITAVGQHSVPGAVGFAIFEVYRERDGICCDIVLGANSSVAPYGDGSAGSFVFSDTVELDPDRDLLRVRAFSDATAFQAVIGSTVASATVDDVDFLVSPGFPNRNAYTFVLPEPSGAMLQLAGLASVLALSRARRHGRRERAVGPPGLEPGTIRL